MYVRNVHVMGEHAVLGAGSVINELCFVYFWSVFQCKNKTNVGAFSPYLATP